MTRETGPLNPTFPTPAESPANLVLLKYMARAERLIRKHKLHACQGSEPVLLERLVDPFGICALPLDYGIMGFTYRWRRYGRWFVRIAYDIALDEPERSAERRHVIAHELCHIICGHRGQMWILWDPDTPAGRFHYHFNRYQERECDLLASFLLIPLRCLQEADGEDPEYLAGLLDVPEKLVWLRRELFLKWGR